MDVNVGPTAVSARDRVCRWFPLALIALGVLAWSNAFSCAFIFDDKSMIVGNFRLHRLWPPWMAVSVPTRFLVDLTFALNHAISGFNPADFHLTNLAIHITAGLLLYGFVRRTLALPRPDGQPGDSAADWPAFLIAALWLVHPLQTESVTYVVQRAEALMGAMMLGVCYAFVRSLDAPHPARWRVLAWILCLLGMGTKEMMVTTPFLLILFDATFVTGSWHATLRKRGWFHAAMIATLAGFAALMATGVARARGGGAALYDESLRWDYLLTQSQAILHYLRLTVIPWPLCLDYKWPLAGTWREVAWQAPLVTAMVATVAYGAIRLRRWAFPGAWALAILAPTSTLIPLPDVVFEHRMYLPLAGLIALAVAGGACGIARLPMPGRQRIRHAAAAALLLAVAGLAVLTWVRNNDYSSEETMWRDVVRKRPDNYRACIALTTSLLNDQRPKEALPLVLAMLERLPDYSHVPFEEIERRWMADRRNMPVMEYSMGHNNAGAAYLALDGYDEAEAHFREAVRTVPSAFWAHNNLAKTFYFQGRTNEAIAAWRTTLSLNPRDPRARTFLAIALTALGQDREAIEQYREALRLDPDDAFVRAQLAWALATHPDADLRNGRQAVAVAEPLVAMSEGRSTRALDVLAAAYAEAGQMQMAVQAAERALDAALRGTGGTDRDLQPPPQEEGAHEIASAPAVPPTAGSMAYSNTVEEIRQRLALYREGQPFHAPRRAGETKENPHPEKDGGFTTR